MKKKAIIILAVFMMIMSLCGCAAQNRGTRILKQVSPGTIRLRQTVKVDIGDYTITSGGTGSGFFINNEYLVTNHHVVSQEYIAFKTMMDYANKPNDFYRANFDKYWFASAEGEYVEVIYSTSGNDIIQGRVYRDWPEIDVAVVRIDPNDFKGTPLKLSNADHIKPGMDIFVVGFPGVGNWDKLTSETAYITNGVLSKITQKTEGYAANSTPYDMLNHNAQTNAGNSGGPIVDNNGFVIGVAASSSTVGDAYYGTHIQEVISRLGTIKYTKASDNSVILWIAISVLTAAIAGTVFLLLKRKKKKTSDQGLIPPTHVTSKTSVEGISGSLRGKRTQLTEENDCIFGKDPASCTIIFGSSEKTVSSRHCLIHYSKSHQCFVIRDLNSTNGTILVRGNQQRSVPSSTGLVLQDGDMICIPDKSNSFRVNL